MGDNTTPSRAANMEKAEGDRSAEAAEERPRQQPERAQAVTDPDRGAEDDWPAGRSER